MGPAFQSAKTAIKQRFPGLIPIYGRVYRRLILQPRLRRMSAEAIFEEIYKSRSWGGTESHSGRGSSLAETAAIRDALPQLVSELGIESMLDIPCGDGHWMSQVTMGLERYIGGDIVSDLLVHCRSRWPPAERPTRNSCAWTSSMTVCPTLIWSFLGSVFCTSLSTTRSPHLKI